MAPNARIGIAYAFACLALLGVMPIIAGSRPAGVDGLTFTIWLTFWQLVSAIPLTVHEARRGKLATFRAIAPDRRLRAALILLLTGSIFAVSTLMYVVAADKAGPVNLAIALQAYPLFAILLERVMLGKRKTRTELAFTLLILVALLYLTTNGTFMPHEVSWWSVFTLGIPILWSVAHIVLRQEMTSTPITPNQLTTTRLVVFVFLLVVSFVVGEPGSLLAGFASFDLQKTALLFGALYYWDLIFWFKSIRHIDVSVASSIGVPTPAVTMLVAVVFTGAEIATYQIVALVVIAVGLYGLLWAGRHGRRIPAVP